MIRVEDVEFRYPEGAFRLEVGRLEVGAGERVAIVGPSGSGKTTLLRLVSGILTPARGRILTNEVEVSALGDRERRAFRLRTIGLVFQEFELLEYLSVLDNVLLPYLLGEAGGSRAEARTRAVELARRIGLEEKLGRRPDHLSQGERQRVAVCRALVTRPPLLLADEPTGNLDPSNKVRILDELIEFAEEAGATLLVVTHDQGLLERFARVIDVESFYGAGAVAQEAAS